jgi:hypothetical protein
MAQIPHADKGMICPLHRVDMSKVCHTCPLWVMVRGKHPQTNADVDGWNCALAWMPVLLIDNSQQQRSTGAAIESFRNEVVKESQTSNQNLATLALLAAQSQQPPQALPPGNGQTLIPGR